jgi:hypothetical protein
VLNALADLEQAVQDVALRSVEDLPKDVRWRLHVLAASMRDYTFWVEEVEGAGIDFGWQATEVESGVSGMVCSTPEDALTAYWHREYA